MIVVNGGSPKGLFGDIPVNQVEKTGFWGFCNDLILLVPNNITNLGKAMEFWEKATCRCENVGSKCSKTIYNYFANSPYHASPCPDQEGSGCELAREALGSLDPTFT